MKRFKDFINESKILPSGARGYSVGEYLYHVTPTKYIGKIKNVGIQVATGGTTHLNKTYSPRIFLATSLIAAYDLSQNFSAHRNEPHTIIKIDSSKVEGPFEKDYYFSHGVYVTTNIPLDAIVEYISADDLFGEWDEEELSELYDESIFPEQA
jgi:hypothetical protein